MWLHGEATLKSKWITKHRKQLLYVSFKNAMEGKDRLEK